MHKKSRLPRKTCIVCGRPFTWRKKWKKVWDEVKYCSDRCRRNSGKNKSAEVQHWEFSYLNYLGPDKAVKRLDHIQPK
ncbi:MAG: DUF2256 domain-containing protein [Bacteroidetes bacterium]|nr:DUF2256 domain-containing protein [Bacteroidota bacterium]